ncbi:hypothetical protein MJO28_006368 [Puccinia striiformis f. sp. tritici]|uniref:Uncharacterized protein n=1 Tax=Puccinia striiformis f. sp. tritici TaxID=168172 RepID=A0ACC0EGU6_9BASI|nr:hypothetical protein MJO28_006368 [Puccinia striiformis f. sp. tritici]
MAGSFHVPAEDKGIQECDQHSEIFGSGSASVHSSVLYRAAKKPSLQPMNSRIPPLSLDHLCDQSAKQLSKFARNYVLPSSTILAGLACQTHSAAYIFIVQGHLKPNSHTGSQLIQQSVEGFMPRKFQVTNFPPLPKHSPVEFSQTTYLLGSDHPVFAPGSTPWPVEGPMGNPMHPIQPLLGQGPDQNQTGYKNPRNLRIFSPVSDEYLLKYPTEFGKRPALGLQDLHLSPEDPPFNCRTQNVACLRPTEASQVDHDHLFPRGGTEGSVDSSMNYLNPYSPSYYYHNGRLPYPAVVPNSPYAYYRPYQRNFPLSPRPAPTGYCPPPASNTSTTPQENPLIDDEDFYRPISGVYKLADEPELDRLLSEKTDSILGADPFSNEIGVDFGYGSLPSLADYQMDKTAIGYRDAFNIDDLYLFEIALRLDELLTDKERLRRWDQRLNWENSENKKEMWAKMSVIDQHRIGIGTGSWWAYQLFNLPFDSTYGYYRSLLGEGGMFATRRGAFRKGTIKAHYPLSGGIKSKLPIWRDGGLGLGRSLIAWVDGRPARKPPSSAKPEAKANVNQEAHDTNADLSSRQFRAQCNLANIMNTIRQTSTIILPPQLPQAYYTIPGYQQHPLYSPTKVSDPTRFGNRHNRSTHEPIVENSPGSFHNGFTAQAGPCQNQPLKPQPLKRSGSLNSHTQGNALHPKDYTGIPNLYRGVSVNGTWQRSGLFPQNPPYDLVSSRVNSNGTDQKPSDELPASKGKPTRPASTAPGKSQPPETGREHNRKKSLPPCSRDDQLSTNPKIEKSNSKLMSHSGLPKPPQLYTAEMIRDRMNTSKPLVGFQTQLGATSFKL